MVVHFLNNQDPVLETLRRGKMVYSMWVYTMWKVCGNVNRLTQNVEDDCWAMLTDRQQEIVKLTTDY